MGLGQTMLTVSFLVLLTLAVLNANKMIVDKTNTYYEQEAFKEASYLAHSLLSEISKKAFASTPSTNIPIDTSVSGYADVTGFHGYPLGATTNAKNYVNPGGVADSSFPFKSIRGDNNNYFCDIDDYAGYLRSADSVSTLKGFKLRVDSVYFVDPSLAYSSSRTYMKKIIVKVWNPNYLRDTLTFSTVISY